MTGVKTYIAFVIFMSLSEDISSSTTVEPHAPTFRAAVYEHIPTMLPDRKTVVSRSEALDIMTKNLQVYENQTKNAKQQGAEIIVFPEDGIYGMGFSRKSILPFLEKIPDPEKIDWSPCLQPGLFPRTPVQKALSCMAKDNGIYLVANMGDHVPCNATEDPKCPSDGHYQFNTDVAYSPDGRLLAKYHKTNLFYEIQFDTPKSKVVFFDTPFGRFGMLTCFDLLFKDPAVIMVTEHGIRNIAFPTAWMDALPLLSALGYHSSFAHGLGVNFLSANIHLPKLRFHGSGIYTPKGMAGFYFDNDPLSPGKLVVSAIDVLEQNNKSRNPESILMNQFNDKTPGSDEFKSKLFDDLFTFRLLDKQSGELKVCQRNVCCFLNYSFADDPLSHKETFAFGVFDGLHTLEGQYYFQICTLLKCAQNDSKSSCGSPTNTSSTTFESFSIAGHFQTKFVYPQVILSSSGQLALADQNSWSFQENTLKAGPGLDKPVLSAALFGRYYSQDDVKYLMTAPPGNKGSQVMIREHSMFCLFVGLLMFRLVL